MKTHRPLILTGVIIVICLVIGVLRAMNLHAQTESHTDMSGLATPDHPVPSPSGKFLLTATKETIEETRHWRFTVTDQAGNALFTCPDAFRIRDALFILWDEHDRVWVYSGDLGTFFWERVTDDHWEKRAFVQDDSTPVPPLLKELRPKYFQ